MSMNIVKGILLVLPKDFPDELRPMMKQCWKKKREERCDIDEVLDYLENFRNSINETPKHPHQSCSLSDDKGSKTENDDENQPSSYNKEVTSEPIEVENRPVNMDSPQKGYEVLTVKEDLTLIDQPSFSKDDSSIPTGKLREEISKLYKHIEGSCLSLKQVMEEFFDKRRCHEFLSVGERRHLMINIVEVEQSISSLYDWFKTCQWRIPTVCGLITNIFDYLQPIANFAVYSHVQMNMIESIRRCTDNGGSLADDEDANTLTFTDVQTILMKQANWLKKFQCIIQGIQSALTAKMTKEESVIDEFKQCCNKLKEMVDNCNDHENRIINKMEDHITSLVPKLQFTAEEEEEKKAQKLMVYGECWVQKKGDVTVLESTKRGKKRLIEKRKCTIIAFVNTFLIVQPNIDVFEVDDCIHKKDIQVERGGYENVDKNFGMEEIKNETGERVKLTKLDPYSRHSVQNYILYFEDRSEISEWLKVLKFSERESLAQEVEYITPLGIMNEAKEQPTSEDQVSSGMEQNDHEVKILFDIADLNKKNIKSLSKLNELYINDAAFNKILEEGEKHHLYRNVTEVKDMVESFDSVLESNRRDSVVYFTELNNRLKEGSFRPIVKYRANMCFQQNMLEFQRKHRTTFIDVLEKCERTQSGISLMDLEARLMKPLDWLTCLHKKSKALNSSATCTMFEHDQLQTETIKRLEHFIQEDQEMTKSIERKKSSHMTSVLLDLQIPSPRDHQLLQKLLNIKDDWLNKHGCFTLYRKGDVLKKGMRKKYPTMKESIHIYASTSVIIMNSKQLCKCYDRNYADIESVNTRNRKGWMHEKGFLFKLWIYERVSQNDDYQPVEHLLRYTSESDQIVKDFMKWKVALVVSTGESGKYDDYTRPRHIISKPFTTDRDNELELEVNDFVELLEHREAIGQVWVKGIRYERDGMSGWFPRDRLGPERSSEYSIGQKIKLRFKNERENKGDRRHRIKRIL
ncbi:uncharacterized protein [Antedon mediterranea]|uniref:uncharacterized protein isoform X2 n=1 Tax=Antedon mediterranea TaxID=105859 RepID=UPI003AF72387